MESYFPIVWVPVPSQKEEGSGTLRINDVLILLSQQK